MIVREYMILTRVLERSNGTAIQVAGQQKRKGSSLTYLLRLHVEYRSFFQAGSSALFVHPFRERNWTRPIDIYIAILLRLVSDADETLGRNSSTTTLRDIRINGH